MDLLQNILIITGESFWLISGVAQLIKLHRTRNVRGISPIITSLNAAGNIAWVLYFSTNHLWFPVATNIGLMIVTLGLLGYLFADRKTLARALVAVAVIGCITALLLILFGSYAGWFAVAYNTIAGTPRFVAIVRTHKVSGLSERGLWIAIGAMTCTATYAALIGSLPLLTGCTQGFLYDGVVIQYYYRYRKRTGN